MKLIQKNLVLAGNMEIFPSIKILDDSYKQLIKSNNILGQLQINLVHLFEFRKECFLYKETFFIFRSGQMLSAVLFISGPSVFFYVPFSLPI